MRLGFTIATSNYNKREMSGLNMIRIEEYRAENDMILGKYLFLKNKTYLSRLSKDGNKKLVLDENGKWFVLINYDWAICHRQVKDAQRNFTNMCRTEHLKNYKDLNTLIEYLK